MADPDPLMAPRDLPRAMMLLTRVPVPGADGARAAASAWAWPLVGLFVGTVAAAVAALALALGLPDAAAAGLALGVMIVITGGLHEDGLADFADGIWGGQTADRRLEIMKDSRIGSYGVLALILVLGLEWVLLTALIGSGSLWTALLLPAVLSRAAMVGVMSSTPFARADGLARRVGRPGRATALAALLIAALVAAMALGWAAFWVVAWVAITALCVARLARAKIGGQTGDVLGATQALCALTALASLGAVLP